jgi:hypothetical protein
MGTTVRPAGFRDFGLKYLHNWALHQLGVRNQRLIFNRAATGSIWITAASCAVVGASMVNGTGTIVGGLLGLMLADHVFRNYRFIR